MKIVTEVNYDSWNIELYGFTTFFYGLCNQLAKISKARKYDSR